MKKLVLLFCTISFIGIGPVMPNANAQHSGHQGKDAETADHTSHDMHNEGSKKMHQSMESMMKEMQAMEMKNDADHDFATMMKRHHQSGIEMAQAVIDHGKDPKLKAMARKMIKEQKKESDEFQRWLQNHK